MYVFSKSQTKSEKKITAKACKTSIHGEYDFKKLEYPDLYIPNRTLAHTFSLNSEEYPEFRESVNDYNRYIEHLKNIPGFLEFFIQHDLLIRKNEVVNNWSTEVAEVVFSKRQYCFSTDISVVDDYLFDNSYPLNCKVKIDDCELLLPIGKHADCYPDKLNGKRIIWNYIDNGHDFCFSLWSLLGGRHRKDEEIGAIGEGEVTYYGFDVYDQVRNDDIEPQLARIFNKLQSLGYIDVYTIMPEKMDPRWEQFGKSDGSIDCAIVDTSFLKNKLIKEQIEILLWTSTSELDVKEYFLTDESDNQLLSSQPGAFGGHKELGIYGRLDCPSAARFLAKGQYAKHRVFFADVETAVKAGYRPCAKCMPEEYKIWKTSKQLCEK